LPFDEIDELDAAAVAFDKVLSNDHGAAIVASFHENVGADGFDEPAGRVVVKQHRVVDTPKGRDDTQPFLLAYKRALRALQAPDRIVPVDAYDQEISERARSLEVANVSDVQQVEAAVCERYDSSALPLFVRDAGDVAGFGIMTRLFPHAKVLPQTEDLGEDAKESPQTLTTTLRASRAGRRRRL
jgi:hypothetical protein